jgi:hypothetical protein
VCTARRDDDAPNAARCYADVSPSSSYEYTGCFVDSATRDLGNSDLPRGQRAGIPGHLRVLNNTSGGDATYDAPRMSEADIVNLFFLAFYIDY